MTLWGELHALPDLTDMYSKFKNIAKLDVEFTKLEVVERKILAIHKRITHLNLWGNEIAELAEDTFDDLEYMVTIVLTANRLKALHQNLFKKLYKLREVWLQNNELEVLPEGLFRNNPELTSIFASENNLKIIAIDFLALPKLVKIDFKRNECIDEWCVVDTFCGATSKQEMQQLIWNKCNHVVQKSNIKK